MPDRSFVGTDSLSFEPIYRGEVIGPVRIELVVTPQRPEVLLSAGTTDVRYGSWPALTVRMPKEATGEVGFHDRPQPGADKGICVAKLQDGVARLERAARALGLGEHQISASYGGDRNFQATRPRSW